jgi:hypothetical protein
VSESHLDVVAAVAEELGGERSRAEQVLRRLGQPDVVNHLLWAVRAVMRSADAAWAERPDLFENPAQPDTAAEIAVTAVVRALMPVDAGVDVAPQVLAGRLARVRYKDWVFRLVQVAGTGPAVEVQATLDNSVHPGAPFTTTRTAAILGGDVVDAAFRAVMLVEAHEAAERLQVDGKAVRDPHAASAVPPPPNRRVG